MVTKCMWCCIHPKCMTSWWQWRRRASIEDNEDQHAEAAVAMTQGEPQSNVTRRDPIRFNPLGWAHPLCIFHVSHAYSRLLDDASCLRPRSFCPPSFWIHSWRSNLIQIIIRFQVGINPGVHSLWNEQALMEFAEVFRYTFSGDGFQSVWVKVAPVNFRLCLVQKKLQNRQHFHLYLTNIV
jgi:hypothetical protein